MIAFFFVAAACGNGDMKASIVKMNEGMKLAGNKRYTEAETLLEEAITLFPENHKAAYNLGMIRDRLKEPKKAVEAFEVAVQGAPDDAMYHYHLGASLNDAGEASLSQVHLEKAVELNERLYKAHYKLGRVYDAQDKAKEAAEAWTKSASLAPSFGKPFNSLGRLYTRWNYLEQAISVLQQGTLNVKDGDDLTDIFYHLGLAYERQGNWDKAIEAYTNALAKRKGTLDALRQRGFAYSQKGDKEKAREDLQAFVDQGGGGDATQLQIANQRLFKLMQ